MKLLFLFHFVPCWMAGQVSQTGVAELFFKDKNLLWEKSYQGVWDDVIPVKLELGYDGTACKGQMFFSDNKARFIVSGTLKDNDLLLEEQDLLGNVTGYLALKILGDQVRGTWYNAARTFNARIVIREGPPSTTLNYWTRSYALKSAPAETLLIQQKDFSDQIYSRFYYGPLNKTLEGTSPIKHEEDFHQETVLFDPQNQNAGRLDTWRSGERKIEILYKQGKTEWSRTLDLIAQVGMHQESYTDHWMTVDFVFPETDKPGINHWFKSLVDSFLILVQDKKAGQAEQNQTLPANRMAYRLSIWPQVQFLTDQYLSGYVHAKTSWDESIQSQPFLFDLKKGNLVREAELFQNYKSFLEVKELLIEHELRKLRESDGLMYEGLTAGAFTLFTLRKEGLCYSAPFSLQYGFRQVIVPYKDVKDLISPRFISF
ncbi:MAG TPA: hypothetical protein PKM27_16295 [Saprospiraceae bacterium]|nr:hypothetical protein [Saprospiraceae bacterium]HNT21660.1 hypothetical protein [Saprospiraceae bacterium]